MLGRPASWAPVWKNVMAGSWLIASVCIDLMKHSSSATLAVCGSSSLTQAPLWPWRANRNRLAATGKLSCREVMPVSRWPLRIESGSSVPAKPLEQRLVVEQVHLRRRARLEQVDHPLGAGAKLGKSLAAGAELARARCMPPSSSDASASDPSPRLVAAGTAGDQRVIRHSAGPCAGSLLGEGLVEVEDQSG